MYIITNKAIHMQFDLIVFLVFINMLVMLSCNVEIQKTECVVF